MTDQPPSPDAARPKDTARPGSRRLPFLLPLSALVAGLATGGLEIVPRPQLVLGGFTIAALAGLIAPARRLESRLGIVVLALLFTLGVVRSDRLNDGLREVTNLGETPVAHAAQQLPWRVSRFLQAAMLGDRSVLLPHERAAYRRAGVSHLLAVSGLNVAVLGGMAWLVSSLLLGDSSRADYAAITVIAAYVIGIGAPPSALRSGLMCALLLFARARGHASQTLNVLLAAAFLTILFDPSSLFDAGFQLSYAATLGLIGWSGRIERLLPGPRRAVSLFAATIAAQAATLPISAWHFREIAPIAFLANLAVIPLFTLAQLLTTAALLHVPLAASAADHLIDAMFRVISGFALLPGSAFAIDRPPLVTTAALMALCASSIIYPRRVLPAATLAIAAVLGAIMHVPDHGVFLVRASSGAYGLIVHESAGSVVLDDGLTAPAWRDAFTRLGVERIETFALHSPGALSSHGARGAAAIWPVEEWRIPRKWATDLDLTGPLDDLRRTGGAIQFAAGGPEIKHRSRLFTLGAPSQRPGPFPETAAVAVDRVGRDAIRIRLDNRVEHIIRF